MIDFPGHLSLCGVALSHPAFSHLLHWCASCASDATSVTAAAGLLGGAADAVGAVGAYGQHEPSFDKPIESDPTGNALVAGVVSLPS